MKLIRLLSLLFLLTSCNKYFGIVEDDYKPKNKLVEVFNSNINVLSQLKDFEFEPLLYPPNYNSLDRIQINELNDLITLEENSVLNFFDEKIYFTKKNTLYTFSIKDLKVISSIKLELDKDEIIIAIINYPQETFILTDQSKIFEIKQGKIGLLSNFNKYITSNILVINKKIIAFNVFGEALMIDPYLSSISSLGEFQIKQGVIINSQNYKYMNQISHLYNSGTLIYLNSSNLNIENNYFHDDLNMLSSLGLFEEFVDAPFQFKDNSYFIEKSGLISVYNPLNSEFLWEVNINSSIKDYNFTKEGKLILLTSNSIIIIDKLGRIIFELKHDIKLPMKILSNIDLIFIFDKKGITTFNVNTQKKIDYLKKKFSGDLELFVFNSNVFLKDTKNLFKISE